MFAASSPKLPSLAAPPSRAGLRLHGLDELRGLAALCVVLHHAESAFQLGHMFARGYLAVDFFFLMSGYLLGLAYETRFARGLSTVAFMRFRIVRLWPVLAAGLALAALCLLGQGVAPLPVLTLFLAQLFFIPIFAPMSGIFPLIGVQWSLWFELQANLAHGVVLRHMRIPALIALVAISGFILTAQCLSFGRIAMGDMMANWWGGFARIGFSYGFGYLLSRSECREAAAALRIPAAAGSLAPAAMLLMLVGPAFLAPGSEGMTDLLVVLFLFPLLLIASVAPGDLRAPGQHSALGFLSYPLYAIHLPVIGYVAGQGLPESGAARLCLMMMTALAALGIAYLVAIWLEPRGRPPSARR